MRKRPPPVPASKKKFFAGSSSSVGNTPSMSALRSAPFPSISPSTSNIVALVAASSFTGEGSVGVVIGCDLYLGVGAERERKQGGDCEYCEAYVAQDSI